MSFYLRPDNGRGLGGVKTRESELGRGYHRGGEFRFIRSTPLAMHDDCARDNLGEVSAPRDAGRKAFAAQAGQAFCWSPGQYGGETPCYFCGKAC
jgi:hypothetical protein